MLDSGGGKENKKAEGQSIRYIPMCKYTNRKRRGTAVK